MLKDKKNLSILLLSLIIISAIIAFIFIKQSSANKDLELELLQKETNSLFVSEQKEDLSFDASIESFKSIKKSAKLIKGRRLNSYQERKLTNILKMIEEAELMFNIMLEVNKLFDKDAIQENIVNEDLSEIKKK